MKANAPIIAPFLFLGGTAFRIHIPVTKIGRGEHNDLYIPDKTVSRSHAEIRHLQGAYILNDLDSTSGTFVNRERITEHVLQNNDVIHFASISLVFIDVISEYQPDLSKETIKLSKQDRDSGKDSSSIDD